jgi:hypothetical protein
VQRYVEAPGELEELPRPVIFLAGGITNCPDWQRVAVDTFHRAPGTVAATFTICNPRRSVFDVSNVHAAQEQVTWEWHALRLADIRVFWFPACKPEETVQPIALFELGRWTARAQPGRLIIGADMSYPRVHDIQLQVHLERPSLHIHPTLAGVLLEAIDAVAAWPHEGEVCTD